MVKENREFKAIKWVLTQIFIAFIIFENDAQIAVSTSSISNLLNSQFTTMSVSLSNIMVNGVPIDQFFTAGNVSSFNNPTNPSFPLPNGVLLTTGNGVGAIGPNTSGSFTNNLPATSNVSTDQALNYIANGTVTNGVVLEFDFIPAGDSVSFNYLFASDEYPEFSPSTFNDAFGFILWGPGISGPYTLAGYPSGGMNLALIPGTNSPVTINNVGPGATQNPAFYVNNLSGAAYGSATDLTVELAKEVSVAEINSALKKASEGALKGYLTYTEDPIVSADIVTDPSSCIVDAGLTKVIGTTAKVVGWYDNEWGYSNRLVDLIKYIGKSL